jgi:hypothetical protein
LSSDGKSFSMYSTIDPRENLGPAKLVGFHQPARRPVDKKDQMFTFIRSASAMNPTDFEQRCKKKYAFRRVGSTSYVLEKSLLVI